MKVIFFGTPDFTIPCLQALIREGFIVVGVVTQSDKPAGRGMKPEPTPIKTKAQELGLKILNINNLPAADVGVVAAYGKIIPKKILNHFPKGILNIHPSLLPKYRGPSPVQTAILNGDMETGVTIMLLDEEMDHGPILARNTYHIPQTTRSGQLLRELFKEGAELLVETLTKYLNEKIKPQEQDHSKTTFTKMLKREDGKIDWSKPAKEIEQMIRAYDPWPGTWTIWKNKRVKIIKASVGEDKTKLVVDCGKGSLIIEKLQVEGKKPISGEEYLRR